MYRQWPSIVDFAKRLNDLSEIVEKSKYLDGIVERLIIESSYSALRHFWMSELYWNLLPELELAHNVIQHYSSAKLRFKASLTHSTINSDTIFYFDISYL